MTGHQVMTIERQGGYAARCDTCGDITFGGIATRTEARAALAHENAPGSAATELEGIDPTPITEKETIVSSTLLPTPDIRPAEGSPERAFLDAHPEIVTPIWADEIHFYWYGDADLIEGIDFHRGVGSVEIQQHINVEAGISDTGVTLYIPSNDEIPVSDWPGLRESLRAALELVTGEVVA